MLRAVEGGATFGDRKSDELYSSPAKLGHVVPSIRKLRENYFPF